MPWGDLALHTLALTVYPGAAILLLFGVAAELVAARVATSVPGGFGPTQRAAAPASPALAVAVLGSLAATQLPVPFNPVPALERSVLVAGVALAAGAWVGSAYSREPPLRPSLMLLAHAGWLVALLAPSLAAGTLRPAALGAVAVPAQIPLKVAAAALYLLCLPAVLQLLPETAPRPGPALARAALWLPLCGLFAGVYLQPASDDLAGIARFAAEVVIAAVVAVALAVILHRTKVRTLYWPAIAALSTVALALALLAVIVS
jgi:hypothetical protein